MLGFDGNHLNGTALLGPASSGSAASSGSSGRKRVVVKDAGDPPATGRVTDDYRVDGIHFTIGWVEKRVPFWRSCRIVPL